VTGIVEKPAEPSSTLVTTGCCVLPADIFHACALCRPSAEGEYQLSEAVGLLLRAGYEVETVRLGERVNVNTPADVERASGLVRGESEMGSRYSTVSNILFTGSVVDSHTPPCRVFSETTSDRARITPLRQVLLRFS
jgi:dTDP-glucose pyrophosphorylase